MGSVGAEIIVRGHVQGVGYRYFCQARAARLNLTGWVSNLADSSVALHAEGERGSIEALIDELRVGPRAAAVTDVVVKWTPYSGRYQSFSITG